MRIGLLNTMPSLFDDFDHLFTSTSGDYFLDEDQKSYHLSLDLPGFKKEDLKLEIKNSMLIIEAESKGKRSRKYHRSFAVPNTIDMETIEADLKDGVLTLIMNKVQERPKLIQIK